MLIQWDRLNKNEFEPYRSRAAVAVNFASTEQHSTHLPVGTDAIIGNAVLRGAAEMASSPILVLPQACFGYSPHHRFADGFITVSQRTLVEYAKDICRSVQQNGFRRMFLINSHGGNQAFLSAAVNEIGEQYEDSFSLMALRYWDLAAGRIAQIRESPLGGTGHAGEFETSVMMHLAPELVAQDKIVPSPPAAGDPWYQMGLLGSKKYVKFASFDRYHPEGQIGQPQLATPEKGRLFLQAAIDGLAELFDYFAQEAPPGRNPPAG
jgi:creatinine amidohydrolase